MPVVFAFLLDCHPRESGGPGQATLQLPWIPAFAGMTFEKVYRTRLPNLAPMSPTLPHLDGPSQGPPPGPPLGMGSIDQNRGTIAARAATWGRPYSAAP